MALLFAFFRPRCAPKAVKLASSNFKANIMSALNIEPSPLDVGFGEVLHAVPTSLCRCKLLMGAIVATAPAMWYQMSAHPGGVGRAWSDAGCAGTACGAVRSS